ncbi:two-component sensor histidine kinase [Aliidongia dinghuensis]|uniref:histidine kinase n=1 Tax=Aliidongia dinghuensis TaxID=1867774 RepID=A0A8J2YQU1_9PROT|nr:HAMP domain-containing sensor histidine kinase [Aliidongia dinghuensis]GGF06468.1 two-component sensor histidine kinase [Aliidongia dinghuensis]
MNKSPQSVTVRLAVGYGLLVLLCLLAASATFYFATVGVLAREIDSALTASSARLTRHFDQRGAETVRQEIEQLLTDGINQDTEVYLLLAPDGRRLAGNLDRWPGTLPSFDTLSDQKVVRYGRTSTSRLLPHQLANGYVLVVGRDMQDQREIEALVVRALAIGSAIAVLLAAFGASLFRRQIERRIMEIRRMTLDIKAGNLRRRIPITEGGDEFAKLNRDLNNMLDWIEHLMDGVRHVSNAIAHDLRTPLARIRSRLDEAIQPQKEPSAVTAAAEGAIQQIDDLSQLLDRLLQIAEAEAGAGRESFSPVDLRPIVVDIAELYDAAVEACGMTLETEIVGEPRTFGDKHLLASALANLVDNSIKHSGAPGVIRITAIEEAETVVLAVNDNGTGIPADELPRVVERFYRLDQSRSRPGSGLGLSIVAAITSLHFGKLKLEDARPGLSARIVLPKWEARTFPNGKVAETSGITGAL